MEDTMFSTSDRLFRGVMAAYFGYANVADFASDWAELSSDSRREIVTGLEALRGTVNVK
jgi:hypothetical protein